MDDFLTVFDLRGGRTCQLEFGTDSNQVEEALNADFFYSRCGNKRWGAESFTLNGGYGGQSESAGSMFKHVPAGDDTLAELWSFNSDRTSAGNQVARWTLAGGWTAVTALDALNRSIATDARSEVRCATLNGKLFCCYKANTATDRLHVWDGATLRRVGITGVVGPSSHALGLGGSITADTRAYKITWLKKTGGVITYRSDLSNFGNTTAVVGDDIVVVRPTLPGEGETDWEVYAYSISDNYATGYLVSTSAAATVAYVDNANILNGNAPPEIGLNALPTSWKYIMVHGNRLLGAGSHESGGKNNRVWFTAPLGSSDKGDDERVPNTLLQKNQLDFDENDGGVITGFGGVINGTPVVFKYRRTYRMQPTGQIDSPYQQVPQPISNTVGCIRQETVVQGEDENGSTCVYWLSAQGPYRYGAKGLEYLGFDIEDVWADSAGGTLAPPHGVYHADKKQVWWWIGDSSTSHAKPNRKIVFHVQHGRSATGGVRGGWAVHDGRSTEAYASVMFNLNTTTMGFAQVPYVSHTAQRLFFRCDIFDLLGDNGEFYTSYVKTKPYALAGFGNLGEGIEPVFMCKTWLDGAATNLAAEIVADMADDNPVTSDINFTYSGLMRRYTFARMGCRVVAALTIQLRYGDVGTLEEQTSTWWGIESIALQRGADNRG